MTKKLWIPALFLIYPGYLFLAAHWPLIPPAVRPDHISKTYTDHQLQYFSETAFEGSKPLERWTVDVRVELVGDATPAEKQDVANAVRELQALHLPVSVSLVSSEGNLPVSFLTKAPFDKRHGDSGPPTIGFVEYGKAYFNQVRNARIFVRTDIEPNKKKEVLRHELCHALGLHAHSPSYYPAPNLMGKEVMTIDEHEAFQEGNTRFPTLDSAALTLLYHPDVPLGCRRQTFQQALRLRPVAGILVTH